MAWQVYKFGGSSLGTAGRLPLVLTLIRRALLEPRRLAVVVSALGDSTDWLLAATRDTSTANSRLDDVLTLARTTAAQVLATEALSLFEADTRALLEPVRQLLDGNSLSAQAVDEVVSVGERISASLLSRALGTNAFAVDARDLVVTDDTAQHALVDVRETRRRFVDAASKWNGVPVVTGFIGRSRAGHTTTLGRNGSDYTASLLAVALEATDVTVWTDVPGVFTADPSLVTDAYPVTRLTWFEALELAHFGTRMFHARTVVPLLESKAALTIRSTTEPDLPGTRIDGEGHLEPDRPTCVTSLERLALIHVEARRSSLPDGFLPRALLALDEARVTVWLTNQTGLGVSASFVVSVADADRTLEVLQRLDGEDVVVAPARGPVTLVTLVAERMGQEANVAGRFFHALGAVGIKVRAIAQGANERSISCVVDAADTAQAVRTVHAAFNFSQAEVNVLLLGDGTVGGQLLEQLSSHGAQLTKEHGVRVRLVGLADSRASVFDAEGVAPELAKRRLVTNGPRPEALLTALSRLPFPVIVDCTAAEGQEELYVEAFSLGISVVAANKKPLVQPWERRQTVMREARRFSRSYLYETTCGASLPVVETLKNLVRTGDVVHRIEGALSGTLAFLSDEVTRGAKLSEAVLRARQKGLTEPDPRDDLSGLDVGARAGSAHRALRHRRRAVPSRGVARRERRRRFRSWPRALRPRLR